MKRDENGNFPVMENIRDNADELLQAYVQKHSKAFAVRVDVHFPQDYDARTDNKPIGDAIKKTIQTFDRKGYDPKFIRVTEQEDSPNPHFHLFFLLNGHKTRSERQVFDTMERHWGATIKRDAKGLIDYCKGTKNNPHENGIMINMAESIPDAVKRQLDYICKPDGKGKWKDGKRDFSMSRIGKSKKK